MTEKGRTDELLAIIKKALDDHQQDTWVEEIVGGRRGSFVMTGDCSMTGEDGYEGHDEPFTLHQARWVLAALENADQMNIQGSEQVTDL